jgi:hypothetical protein
VSASKTVEVPISMLYRHWSDEKLRGKWLLKDKLTIRKETKDKSMRITWNDETSVDVYFYEKGESKSQVSVQHSKLADSEQVERTRVHWKAALDRLAGALA